MTVYSRGDVILVEFPFSDGSGNKRRPAVVISSDNYNQSSPDLIIASITSNLGAKPHQGDHVLADWKSANLLTPSLAQTKIATIENSVVSRKLGSMSATDFAALESGLRLALGFRE